MFFWSLIYVLMYWAATDYAQTTNLWPSSMLASLHNQVLLLQFIAYVFVVAYLGSREIEFWEALLFKAEFSKWDINWGTIGGFLGFLNYLYMPQSKILFYFFIVLDVLLLVKFLTTFFKKK